MKGKSPVRLYLCLSATALGLLVVFYAFYGDKQSSDGGNGLRKWVQHIDRNDVAVDAHYLNKKRWDPAIKAHRNLEGVAMSRPCCVSWGPGRVDCFVRSDDGNVHHWWKEDGMDHEWESLCGTSIGEIECVSRGKGHIDVMITGSNNALWTKTYNGYWAEWISRGGRIMETPSCVARTPSVVNCIVRGGNNAGFHIGHTNDKWGTYYNRGGSLQYPSFISARSTTILDLFACLQDNHLYHMHWTPKAWSGWGKLGGGPLQGRPMALSWNSSRIDVFVMGMASRLMHLAWDGKKWLPWEDLGGKLKSVPSCVAFNATIHCFGVGPESNLYRRSYVKGQWSNWILSYGPFQDTPSCVVSNANEVSCYVHDYNREVMEIVYAL